MSLTGLPGGGWGTGGHVSEGKEKGGQAGGAQGRETVRQWVESWG